MLPSRNQKTADLLDGELKLPLNPSAKRIILSLRYPF
jgi:hypothetical protein